MDVEYVSRDSGWRHPGRPRRQVDPAVLTALRTTYSTGRAAQITVDAGTTPEDVRDLLRQLRAGAEQLGKYLRVQPRRTPQILAAGEIRFYIEDAA